MGITYGDHLIDIGANDITPEQEHEIEAREECARRGIDPDELCADGGVTAWMVVDQEMRHHIRCQRCGDTGLIEVDFGQERCACRKRDAVATLYAREMTRLPTPETERLIALNKKLTEDFNTLALDRAQWQIRAEEKDHQLAAIGKERDYAVEAMEEARTYMRIETTHARSAETRAEKLSIALAAEKAINKDLKIELDEARADIEASISDFKVAGGKLSEAQDELSKLRAMLETVHGKFCTIAAGEAWTDTCLDGYRKTPGGLREFAENAAKEINLNSKVTS